MKGKRILLGVTGGIAAYKVAFLIRLLKKKEADVKVIMTPASSDFISPLVISTLSGNPVGIEFWNKNTGEWVNHVEYGLWADLFVIAPLTANTLSKIATGACDNLLLASYLSMRTKTMVVPAMDLDMYQHPTVKRNLDILKRDGVEIIPAEKGALASGLTGEGRMAEPETILKHIEKFFVKEKQDFLGKKVLVTAGPTYEEIDPVRFIGNHSTGKMGYRIADEFARRGAEVILISGPSKENVEEKNITVVPVKSANDMFSEVQKNWKHCDIGVFSAAVADYRPERRVNEKIKKEAKEDLTIHLVKNPDILKWAGENKEKQVLVGFALETQDLLNNGRKKLEKKNLDFIVMNSLKDKGAGFGTDTNKITILDKNNKMQTFKLKSKEEVAKDIVDYVKKWQR